MIKFINPDFKFEDDRGCLVQLVHQGFSQVNYIRSKPGAIRGGHYHKDNKEAFYVISGSFRLVLIDNDTKLHEEHLIASGTFFIIEKNISHFFEFTSDTSLISMYDKGVENKDGTKDIFKTEYPLGI